MSISLKTHKLLWGRSGNKCALADCRNDLIADETETDDESVIGDEAHIVAKKNDGPRGQSDLTTEQRDNYDNLILLCRKHHKIIDDQYNFYSVSMLKQIKTDHEEWVKTTLTKDESKTKDELTYANYIDELVKRLDFENWNAWTSWLMGSNQSIRYEHFLQIQKIPDFIVTRFWPRRIEEIEIAVFNLKEVLNDLLFVFMKHIDSVSLEKAEEKNNPDSEVRTEQFYKKTYVRDEHLYRKLVQEYEDHLNLLDDLLLELTRAGNLLIKVIRQHIYPNYRESEGKLMVTRGPDFDLSYHSYVVEYSSEEQKKKYPYPGLRQFMSDRELRDLCFGSGILERYFPYHG